MAAETIEIRPVSGSLGAEIRGIDLAAPLSETIAGEIRAAFAEHLVLFFHGQRLDPPHQVTFGEHFGPVGIYPFAEALEDHPEVIAIIKEKDQTTNFGGTWHSDTTYLETPPAVTLLFAKEVPPHGGDTLFANMYLAYESLSAGMRRLLDGLVGISSAEKDNAFLRGDHLDTGGMTGTAADQRGYSAEHPVVRTHPVTGRKALYVNSAHTVGFKGMTAQESAPILGYLLDHLCREEFTCRFRWEEGSLAVWDNRCSQHYPLNDYHGFRRVMHRVTIKGERPV
jgi:taurine dioxygenase